MKRSQLFIPMLKETPKEATIQSHILMLRAGLIIKQGSGIYSYLPFGYKILEKVEKIIQEEISATESQEVFLPHLVSKELWEKTGRFDKMRSSIFALEDRHNNPFLLGPTHEESIVDILTGFVTSYKQLPLNFFQIAKKFRDEVRPRYGVMRGREFIMMDGYSLHTDLENLDEYYQRYKRAYRRIFVRLGLDIIPVSADSGDMGGEGSEEFMVPSKIGDDTIFSCSECTYVANQEKATFMPVIPDNSYPLTNGELHTPDVKTVLELAQQNNIENHQISKMVVYKTDNGSWILAVVRGDRSVNETKLKNLLSGINIIDTSLEEVESNIGPIGFLGLYNIEKKENFIIVIDPLLLDDRKYLTGMNKRDYHYSGYQFKEFTQADYIEDITEAQDGDVCPNCKKGYLHSFSGIEVGHIFKLGQDYNKKMGLLVLDKNGKPLPPYMGCYGIGVDRSLAAVIEQNNDSSGMILPLTISPFQIILVSVGKDTYNIAQEIYKELSEEYQFSVLWDDRDIYPGIKFNEADLLGIPIRITVGKAWRETEKLAFKKRSQQQEELYSKEEIVQRIKNYIITEQEHLAEKLNKIDQL